MFKINLTSISLISEQQVLHFFFPKGKMEKKQTNKKFNNRIFSLSLSFIIYLFIYLFLFYYY